MVGFKRTVRACFFGYIIQAVVNNFAPLVFLTFHSAFNISLYKITALASVNFCVQLLVDLLSITFVDKIGYKRSVLLAHGLCASGLSLLTVLPNLCREPFWGLLIAVVIYASGGGLLEVVLSPIMEATPSENKEKSMSMLHSFYCWGSVGVVLVSTAFFALFGIARWRFLVIVFVAFCVLNAIVFACSPVIALEEKEEKTAGLLKNKLFWVFMLLMLCAGACEQAVSQWASAFAESALGVTKTLGDLAGPMLFAAMMGASRLIYGKFGDKINLEKFMLVSVLMCVFSYLLITMTNLPLAGFLGCGLCGFSVGIMWPGIFSTASKRLNGSTSMFAMFSLAGDLGCAAGPAFVGLISGGSGLKIGILAAVIFPVIAAGLLLTCRKKIFLKVKSEK